MMDFVILRPSRRICHIEKAHCLNGFGLITSEIIDGLIALFDQIIATACGYQSEPCWYLKLSAAQSASFEKKGEMIGLHLAIRTNRKLSVFEIYFVMFEKKKIS